MKNNIISILLILLSITVTYSQQNNETEMEAVKKVVVDAYIDGLFNKGNVEAIRNGFYKDCDIIVFKNNQLKKIGAFSWVEKFEKDPTPLFPGTKYEFTDIRVVGYAAIAVIEIYQNGKHIYTDFLNLYKFDDGWKIVTKTYYSYPKE